MYLRILSYVVTNVNLCKTKIVVFRKRGTFKRSEIWYINGKEIDVVSSYKYFGIIFSIKLSGHYLRKHEQIRHAIGLIFRYHYQCGYLPVGVGKSIFDKMITPVLLYGCEVWGWEYCNQIENVQFYFYKRILGLGSRIHCAYCWYRRACTYILPSRSNILSRLCIYSALNCSNARIV